MGSPLKLFYSADNEYMQENVGEIIFFYLENICTVIKVKIFISVSWKMSILCVDYQLLRCIKHT